MADLSKSLHSLLANDPLVGGTVGGRVFPVAAPQGTTLPYAVYRIIGVEPNDTKNGVSEVDEARVQIELIDTSYQRIVQTAAAVRTNLDRYRGTVAGLYIDGIKYLDYQDDFSPEPGIYQHYADYQIRYHR
jgi:hypothetical protein